MNTLTNLAKQYFDLELPIEAAELKAAYRQQVKALHPDKNDNDTTAAFQEMQSAYKQLSDSSVALIEAVNNAITDKGIALVDLGLGLSPTVNGVTCLDCQGKGYSTVPGSRFVECTDCNIDSLGLGLGGTRCPQCRGSRGFTALDGSHVICWTCDDQGILPGSIDWWGLSCSSCNGTKRKLVPHGQIHRQCDKCRGIGEIRIYNPVIPKGRFA